MPIVMSRFTESMCLSNSLGVSMYVAANLFADPAATVSFRSAC